ncbi:hypothetical protein Tco_0885943 [Tanacetum coccineum]
MNERKLQIKECKVQEVKASNASLGDKDSSGIVSDTRNDQSLENQSNKSENKRSRSRNECTKKSTSGNDTDIRPTYNTEPMDEVDSNTIPDSSDMCNNEFKDDQNDDHEDERVETSRTLGEFNSTRDSCLIALQNKQTGIEKYKAFNDRTIDFDKLERKLNETLGLLAQKQIDIKEGLKLKAYEISIVKEKNDELVKQSLLTKSRYEGLFKEKTKVITDLKLKEEKDIDKMISMEKQLKFLNEIVYKRNQSIQIIHMLAPKGSTFNGRPTFANRMYLKKAQSKKPCLYEIPYDTSNLANIFVLDREEILTLEQENRSKLNNDLVKPYDYTKQNSLYENFKPASQEHLDQLAHADEVRKKIELVDQAWVKHTQDSFRALTSHDMEEIHADLKYVESLEKEIDELESDKADFSNIYDLLLQECVSKDVICSYLHSLSDLDAQDELQFTPHCWPQFRKLSFAKPYDVNIHGPSRKSPKHVSFQSPRESVGSNDMVHNYYLEEAKKKAQLQKDKALNHKPSVQLSTRLPNTANGNKPKTRNFNQQPRNWPPSMSSRVSNRPLNIAEPPRNQKPFLKSKDLAYPTCKKCIYNANHDSCILKYLSEVNSRAPVQKNVAQSYKITKRYIPVEKKIDSKKHDRQIPIGQQFSPNKSSAVYLKTTPPMSGLTWKPMGRIFTYVGLKWIPIRKSVETYYNTTICAKSSSLSVGNSKASEPISSQDVPVLRTSKHGESNTSVLEDLTLYARNPVKENLLN